jgi:hypothetical protein
MLPHQTRVVLEKTELDDKLSKLKSFISGTIFPSLESAEQLRLVRQARIMEEYSNILDERVANFKEN